MEKKNTDKKDPSDEKNLEGFKIHINEFGEIVSNRPIDKLNDFLDEHVDDLKLSNRKEEEE